MGGSSKENFIKSVNHIQPEKVVVEFGATNVTGIHVLIIEKLRDYFGLEKRPVKVLEPYFMLGEIDEELTRTMNIDVIGLFNEKNNFGVANKDWKVQRMPWGQEILLPGQFNYTINNKGDILMYPEGDTSVSPSALMPVAGYFFDPVERQGPINEETLLQDNTEEFGLVSEEDLKYWSEQVESADNTKVITASFGGTSLGSIANIPAIKLKQPKGIRSFAEWYMSLLTREDLIKNIYDRQTDIAIENLRRLSEATGDKIDVVFICGSDFGTQNSLFYSTDTYRNLWLPYYKKVNDWIHDHTRWKTFKHSCGAVEPLMDLFIESGFDIINPVQINAAGMDPGELKKKYGERIVFWGGGVDTQGVFAFGTPQQVKDQVKRNCEIFNNNGGFVFNTVHNIQANVPFENVIAMLEALKEINEK